MADKETDAAAERVQIARDVIAQLAAKRIIAAGGSYIRWAGFRNQQAIGDMDAKVQPPPPNCKVCAIGAVFVCALDRHNELRLRDTNGSTPDDDNMLRYLARWFDEYQLRLMECAFEGSDVSDALPDDDAYAAVEFGEQHEHDADALMRAIMNNVIANKGTFKP